MQAGSTISGVVSFDASPPKATYVALSAPSRELGVLRVGHNLGDGGNVDMRGFGGVAEKIALVGCRRFLLDGLCFGPHLRHFASGQFQRP